MATGLEKVSFHSNARERQGQRMLKLPHNCTHLTSSKVMLKILQARLQQYVNHELPDVQAGFRKGRGTAANMDQFIVVIEPGARSVQTYRNVKRLANDLGVKRVRVVANKVRDTQDEEFVRSAIPAEDLLGIIHYNTEVIDADRNGKSPYDFSPTAIEEIRKIKEVLDQE